MLGKLTESSRTGRWRSVWTIEKVKEGCKHKKTFFPKKLSISEPLGSSDTLSGNIKLLVHYFEDGNVQLHNEFPQPEKFYAPVLIPTQKVLFLLCSLSFLPLSLFFPSLSPLLSSSSLSLLFSSLSTLPLLPPSCFSFPSLFLLPLHFPVPPPPPSLTFE